RVVLNRADHLQQRSEYVFEPVLAPVPHKLIAYDFAALAEPETDFQRGRGTLTDADHFRVHQPIQKIKPQRPTAAVIADVTCVQGLITFGEFVVINRVAD